MRRCGLAGASSAQGLAPLGRPSHGGWQQHAQAPLFHTPCRLSLSRALVQVKKADVRKMIADIDKDESGTIDFQVRAAPALLCLLDPASAGVGRGARGAPPHLPLLPALHVCRSLWT